MPKQNRVGARPWGLTTRLGWGWFFWWVTFKSLKTWMSHFQVSRDLDESLSSLSRLGWGLERLGGPLPWKGVKEGRKGTKKKNSIFFTARALVQWIHCTSARAVHVHLCTASLVGTRDIIIIRNNPWVRHRFKSVSQDWVRLTSQNQNRCTGRWCPLDRLRFKSTGVPRVGPSTWRGVVHRGGLEDDDTPRESNLRWSGTL
jgi:hypothetical protein